MSLASATIDQVAWSDPRVHYLAELAGYVDGFDTAIGKMARLWGRCTFLQTDAPGEVEIRAIFGARGVDLLLESGLAESTSDGHVRVKGRISNAGKDRQSWYQRVSSGVQQAGASRSSYQASGGKARAASARRDDRGRLLPRSSTVQLAGAAGSSMSSSTPASGSGSDLPEDLSLRAREEIPLPEHPPLPEVTRSPEASLEPELERSLAQAQAHGQARTALWKQLNDARAQLGTELGIALRPLHPMDPGERALGMRLRESQDLATGVANAEHVIAVVLAEARATGSGQWLTGVAFEDRNWRRALAMTVGEAGKKRAPSAPRGTPQAEEPVRRIKRL